MYANFQNNKIPKDKESFTCLSAILLHSIFVNSNEKYYPRILLKEYKYVIKNKKIKKTNNEDLELSEFDDH